MLQFLFLLDLTFTIIIMGSSGAQVGEVQMHQTRQFNSKMLDFYLN
jgi:hypothetical protein